MANKDKNSAWIAYNGKDFNLADLSPDIAERARQRIEHCQQAVNAAQVTGDRSEVGEQLTKLGQTCLGIGQLKHAIKWYEQALSIFSELGDQR